MNSEPTVALITGGARGIGRAIAARLLQEGMAVAILDQDPAGEQTAHDLGALGPVRFQQADVAREDEVRRAIESGRAELGAAGRPDQQRRDHDPQASGRARARRVGAGHRHQSHGRLPVRQACSPAAPGHPRCHRQHRLDPGANAEPDTEAYAASKGGLVALTHALALSLGPEVRVNCISPCWIHTRGEALSEGDHPQHPAGRVGRPEDVAELALYLV